MRISYFRINFSVMLLLQRCTAHMYAKYGLLLISALIVTSTVEKKRL